VLVAFYRGSLRSGVSRAASSRDVGDVGRPLQSTPSQFLTSQVLLRRRRHPLPEDGALDHLAVADGEEGVHDGFDPRLVHIDHEVLDGLLCRRAAGVVQARASAQRCAAACQTASRTPGAAARQAQTLVPRPREEEEARVSARNPARHEAVLVLVDVLEVHGRRARGRRGAPLHFFDDVERGVQDEGHEGALGRRVVGEAGAATA
jgi:hypothetical protein